MPLHLFTSPSTGARVRLLLASSAFALLSACGAAPTQPAVTPSTVTAAPAAPAAPLSPPAADTAQPVDSAPAAPILGKHADSHGCKPSTGHAWCERSKSCERPWELALQKGFENTPDGWHAYCDGSTR